MTTTPQLNITHITQAQGQKEVTANEGFDGLDNATQRMVDHDASSLGSPTDLNVTVVQFRQNFCHHIIGSAPDIVSMRLPDGQRFFMVWNECGADVIVDTVSGGSPADPITVTDGTSKLMYSDGTRIIEVGA